MDSIQKYNIEIIGNGSKTMVLAQGFGCNRAMWRHLIPVFENDYQLVLFDYVGTGNGEKSLYNPNRYNNLKAYAEDIIDFCRELNFKDVILVGHSVSASIGILAHIAAPDLFESLILITPSPCYINSEDYIGGFEREDIEELIETLENNYLGWSRTMAPAIIGNSDRPQLGTELTNSFCQMDPDIAKKFARVTFFSDNRADLPKINIPTLILQTEEDIIVPPIVGEYMRDKIANSELVVIAANGHLPHVSEPKQTIEAIQRFLDKNRKEPTPKTEDEKPEKTVNQ